ncbi:MAG: hypothetical protein ACLPYS_01165 [Vulcanimicrobiaceae bacterium]|jgi:hypothetical protein
MQNLWKGLVVGSVLVAASVVARPLPASADTTTDVAIAAAAIVGALLIDANNRPYYVEDDRRYYVTADEAKYYRAHHHVVRRQAWVPESEYPVQRNAGYAVSGRPQMRQAPNTQIQFGQDDGNRHNGVQSGGRGQ